MQKQIDIFEQLEQTKQQLRQSQAQVSDFKKREVSPLPPSGHQALPRAAPTFYNRSEDGSVQHSVQKPPANERGRTESYQLYPAAGYQSQPMSQQNSDQRRPRDSQEERYAKTSQTREPELKPITNTYEVTPNHQAKPSEYGRPVSGQYYYNSVYSPPQQVNREQSQYSLGMNNDSKKSLENSRPNSAYQPRFSHQEPTN